MAHIDSVQYRFNGTMDALHGRDIQTQAVVTQKLNVDYDLGKRRRAKISESGVADARVIGDAQLQDNDIKLNIYGGDLLLQDIGSDEFDVGPFFDGRATAYASLAGEVLPDEVRTDDDLYARVRPVGFAAYDSLLSNPASQLRYGLTSYVGGGMGGTTHRKTEPIFCGDLLQYELPPVDPEARAKWAQDLYYDERYVHGAMKPVLSRWNPLDAVDLLADSVDEFCRDARFGELLFEHLDPTYTQQRLGGSPLSRKSQVALLKIRAGISWAYWGILTAERYGYVKLQTPDRQSLANRAAMSTLQLDDQANLANGSSAAQRRALALALGIIDSNGRSEPYVPLMSGIVATACHAFLTDDSDRAAFDAAAFFGAENPLDPMTCAYRMRRFQHDALVGEARAHADVYFSHAARIVARSQRHSHRAGPLDFVVFR